MWYQKRNLSNLGLAVWRQRRALNPATHYTVTVVGKRIFCPTREEWKANPRTFQRRLGFETNCVVNRESQQAKPMRASRDRSLRGTMKCSGIVTAQRQRTTMCIVHGLVRTLLKRGVAKRDFGLRIWPWSKV